MSLIRFTASVAVLGGVAACAAVGLAGSASAEPTEGPYIATMIGGNNDKEVGGTVNWSIVGCGPDCVHLATSGPGIDLHREGPVWRGVSPEGCDWMMDNESLYINAKCGDGSTYVIGMARA